MSKSWQIYALHIVDVAAKIERIQARGDITKDEVLYDAILRNLQTLSEATQMLPDALKNSFPKVPWREVSGFRNLPYLIESVKEMLISDGSSPN